MKRLAPRKSSRRASTLIRARRRPPRGDVVELVAAEVRQRRPPAGDLETRGAKQERVQAGDGLVALRPRPAGHAATRATLVERRSGAACPLEPQVRRPARATVAAVSRLTPSALSSGARMRTASSGGSRARRARSARGGRSAGRGEPRGERRRETGARRAARVASGRFLPLARSSARVSAACPRSCGERRALTFRRKRLGNCLTSRSRACRPCARIWRGSCRTRRRRPPSRPAGARPPRRSSGQVLAHHRLHLAELPEPRVGAR